MSIGSPRVDPQAASAISSHAEKFEGLVTFSDNFWKVFTFAGHQSTRNSNSSSSKNETGISKLHPERFSFRIFKLHMFLYNNLQLLISILSFVDKIIHILI